MVLGDPYMNFMRVGSLIGGFTLVGMRKRFHTKNYEKCFCRTTLGPFLFLLYLKDLDICIKDGQRTMFAYDTSNIRCKQNANPLFNMGHKSEWFIDINVTFNVEKCEAMFSGSKQPHHEFLVGRAFPYRISCKYLVAHLYAGLRFSEHSDYFGKNFTSFVG